MKRCRTCEIEKPADQFYLCKRYKDGLRSSCKGCERKHSKLWRDKNIESCKAKGREYRKTHADKISTKQREWRLENSARKRQTTLDWRKKHPILVAKMKRGWQKRRRDRDPAFKILGNLRTRLYLAAKRETTTEATRTLLGCSPEELRRFLEAQFQPGMNWNNYNRQGWHIDHKKPCSAFDLTDVCQQRLCFHYTNLQPLWAEDNIKKGDTVCQSQ